MKDWTAEAEAFKELVFRIGFEKAYIRYRERHSQKDMSEICNRVAQIMAPKTEMN